VSITEGTSGSQRVFTVNPVESVRGPRHQVNISLEVKVPRDVELEPISMRTGNITITDFDGGVNLRTDDGNISVQRVGSPGSGSVDVTIGSGSVDLSDINGDVRIIAISSNITVRCVKGHVAARVSSGHIAVSNTTGDVEANVSSGVISFTGAIRSEGRYRLKTLSGHVSMHIPDTVGFTAVLSAYSGRIDRDFQFSHALRTAPPGRTNHRLIGMYGDGRGRIELDSFSGNVSLLKMVAGSVPDCQR
jgi:DUF4097 and DUF4098 domain-containing protein YvlB